MTGLPTTQRADPFERFAKQPDVDMRLDHGAALIATDGSEGRLEACIAMLDALAEEARPAVEACAEGGSRLRALIDYLSRSYGLRGNTDDYYDPRNSFIDEVLRRRCGIPISLSVIYMEVGRRLGVPLGGVSFPGHFLISYAAAPAVFIDPFSPQQLLTTRDCARILAQQSHGQLELRPEHVRVATTRQILTRMLSNLKVVHAQRGEFDEAIRASNRILWLSPETTTELRDRGALHYRAGTLRLARADLQAYVDSSGEGADVGEAHALLVKIAQRMRALN